MAESTIASNVPWTNPATNSGNAISSLSAPARCAITSVACFRPPPATGLSCAGGAGGPPLFESAAGEGSPSPNRPRKSAGVPKLDAAARFPLPRRVSGGGGGSFISGRCSRCPVALLVNGAVAVQYQLGHRDNSRSVRCREAVSQPDHQ